MKIVPSSSSPDGQYDFFTRGDANPYSVGVYDSWSGPGGSVPGSQIVGVYQATIPIPYLGAAILDIRGFMYDDTTGRPKTQGILVIVALIVALFAFERSEEGRGGQPCKVRGQTRNRRDHTNGQPGAGKIGLGGTRQFQQVHQELLLLLKQEGH